MKTLINKFNPRIRATAPDITFDDFYYYLWMPDGDYVEFLKRDWTLVEEEPVDLEKAAESYSENRTGGIILDDEVKAFKAGAEWQKKQPITFNCIGKQVTMTVQQLIDYYIDSECADVADECGF